MNNQGRPLRLPAWVLLMLFTIGTTLLAVSSVVPGWSRDVLYLGTEALVVMAGAIALRRRKPPVAILLAWGLILGGVAGYFLADGLWVYYARTGQDPYPSPADALFIFSTIVMICGAALIVRGRQRSSADRAAVYDTIVLGGAVASISWIMVVQPSIVTADAALVELVVGSVYPVLDILLVMVITRLVIAGCRLPPSGLLLLGGLLVLTAADTAYFTQVLTGSYVEWGWVDAGYMLSFGLLGSAILHPSMAAVADAPEQRPSLGRSRLIMLSLGAITPLGLIIVGDQTLSSVLTLTSIAVVLFVVVMLRSWSLVNQIELLTRRRGEKRFSSLVRHSADTIVVVDPDGAIRESSETLQRLWAPHDAYRQTTIFGWVVESDHQPLTAFLAALENLDSMESSRLSVRMHGRDGTESASAEHAEMVGSNLIEDDDVAGIVLTIRDVTQRIELEQTLRKEAAHDGLTGLLNRVAFHAEVEKALQDTSAPSALLLLDVDDFKQINDQRGHVVGDRALVRIAERLTSLLPPRAEAARLGGDEFAVLVPDIDGMGSATTLADEISRAIAVPTRTDDEVLTITTSIGVAIAAPSSDIETFTRHADSALYAAKAAGRGEVMPYTRAMAVREADAVGLRIALNAALAAGDVDVDFQPVLDARSGQLQLAEAVPRWVHPTRGAIPPAEVMSVAESAGLGSAVVRLLLAEACRTNASLPAGTAVSVRISQDMLGSPQLVSLVNETLNEQASSRCGLVLEVAEQAVADVRIRGRLKRLQSQGTHVMVGSFGLHDAALPHLLSFHADIIKLAPAGVADPALSPMLKGLVEMISSLDIPVIVPGIDTREQLERLRGLPISGVQGHAVARLTSRPELLELAHGVGVAFTSA